MSGEVLAPEGFPFTRRLSKGERKPLFNGRLDALPHHRCTGVRQSPAP